jgi:hypothetical protein
MGKGKREKGESPARGLRFQACSPPPPLPFPCVWRSGRHLSFPGCQGRRTLPGGRRGLWSCLHYGRAHQGAPWALPGGCMCGGVGSV